MHNGRETMESRWAYDILSYQVVRQLLIVRKHKNVSTL